MFYVDLCAASVEIVQPMWSCSWGEYEVQRGLEGKGSPHRMSAPGDAWATQGM